MRRILFNAFYWGLDYLYVVYHQIASIVSSSQPSAYIHDPQIESVPIVLLPGIYENWRFMKPVADQLYQAGYDVHVIKELGYNRGTVEDMASIASQVIKGLGLQRYIIVAHSKGGLIGKYLLVNDPSAATILGMVALNTPFSGSIYAQLLPLKSLKLFAPSSPLLASLKENIIENKVIISVYNRFDPHIPGGSHLRGATNIQLKSRGHFLILQNKAAHEAIIRSIRTLTENTVK